MFIAVRHALPRDIPPLRQMIGDKHIALCGITQLGRVGFPHVQFPNAAMLAAQLRSIPEN